ncbi:unnamed protein product [Rotaria sordida]|uniref:Complexin n=1 Tax=Rotaria sordida TaxID=392033 RepID=A0A814XCM4_9BILA|nr:unnamed protein product [Rotaria sordida]
MLAGNKFDKFSRNYEDEQNVVNDISGEELAAEQNRQAANEKERKARQAKVKKECEEARQKIRDKYNIQKKDDPPITDKTQDPGKINDLITRNLKKLISPNLKVNSIFS